MTGTAEQIRAEIARRLVMDSASEGRCSDCVAPRPVFIERRGDGVNWSVASFPLLPDGCAAFMMRILSEVMRDYDLKEDSVGVVPPAKRPRGRMRQERRIFP